MDEMIIVHLRGGLGNQMFQYAAGRALAQRYAVELKIDLSWYQKDFLRSYGLSSFNLKVSFSDEQDLKFIFGGKSLTLGRIASRLWESRRPYYQRKVFIEKSFCFDPNFWNAPSQVMLVGYWQSEKYFGEIADQLRRDFTLVKTPDERFSNFESKISEVPSVGVHVRRGDYVNNPKTNAFHGLCTLEYYQQAIALISERYGKDLQFFVFTDDPQWVMDNFELTSSYTLIAPSGKGKEADDLILMSRCRHFIIANSSYSWWAAWLGQFTDKMVIAPKHWFRAEGYENVDLIPSDWIRLGGSEN
jgi:hypothetical protein